MPWATGGRSRASGVPRAELPRWHTPCKNARARKDPNEHDVATRRMQRPARCDDAAWDCAARQDDVPPTTLDCHCRCVFGLPRALPALAARTSPLPRCAPRSRAPCRSCRILGALVRPIAHDAREAQREPARITAARLQLVERDLDDELRAHLDDVAARRRIERERFELLGLPLEQLVRQALERLAEHDEAARGVARAEVQIAEPPCRRPLPHSAASTTRSSVCATLIFSHAAPRLPAS